MVVVAAVAVAVVVVVVMVVMCGRGRGASYRRERIDRLLNAYVPKQSLLGRFLGAIDGEDSTRHIGKHYMYTRYMFLYSRQKYRTDVSPNAQYTKTRSGFVLTHPAFCPSPNRRDSARGKP